jgi:hypothetical protein
MTWEQMRILILNIMTFTTISVLATSHIHAEPLLPQGQNTKASSYLELLDQGKFQEAWHSTNLLFQALNDQQKWEEKTRAVRNAYGLSNGREIRKASYRSSYRNAPDGDYFIIQYNSVFEHKLKGIETVVLQCTADKACTVIDYVIN